jgi:hypothetical protein
MILKIRRLIQPIVIRGANYPITAALPPPPISPESLPRISPTWTAQLGLAIAQTQSQGADVTTA